MTKPHHPTTLKQLAELARKKLQAHDWFYMPIFGKPGTYKSSTGLLFIDMAQPEFDPVRQTVLSQNEYSSARRTFPAGSFIMVDEAIKSGKNRRRVMSAQNADMVEDFNTGRKLGHGILDLMPFADDMDRAQLKHAHWTLRMTGKGVGTAYEVRTVGFKKVDVWEEARFNFRVPHCADVRPDLWKPYFKKVSGDVRGEQDMTLVIEERVKANEASARRILTERGVLV
jgi:hypothetical protein